MRPHFNAWQKTELARHPQRPYTLDYVERLSPTGAKSTATAALATILPSSAAWPFSRRRSDGRRPPEGPRHQAEHLPQLRHAESGRLPQGAARDEDGGEIWPADLTFVDTPGAYPGLGAEERGQAEAIARNLREMARLQVPIITTIIGEGGSGGALAIAVADRVLMMENSVYSVISPEGCASIMWRDATKKELAAQAMRITAADLKELAHRRDRSRAGGRRARDHEAAALLLDAALQKHLPEIRAESIKEALATPYTKFRNMAQFFQDEA